MQNQTDTEEENLRTENACDLNVSCNQVDLLEKSEVPGQIPQIPPPEVVHTRERILSISATEESRSSLWFRRVWRLLHFCKKILPFGRRNEDIYVVK
jgi:hypothetical protein